MQHIMVAVSVGLAGLVVALLRELGSWLRRVDYATKIGRGAARLWRRCFGVA